MRPTQTTSPTAAKRRARFLKIGVKRVNKLLQAMDSLGRCSNRSYYRYGPADVENIFFALHQRLDKTRALFETEPKPEFSLKETNP